MKNALLGALAALVLCLGGGVAEASSVFNFSYDSGTGYSGIGQFFGTEVGVTTEYDLSGITGTETDPGGTHTITGLSGYAGADNKLFYPASDPNLVDFSGISFATDNADAWGIGNTGGGDYGLAELLINPNGYCCGVNPIDFRVAAVAQTPLPTTLPLFLSGMVGLGFLARRRRQKTSMKLDAPLA